MSRFAAELQKYGPGASVAPAELTSARDYTRKLATSHYENFVVASWLLPPALRQHFYNVYAYCRWADDLADETGDERQSLELLRWWEQQLDDCYRGRASHPVFAALIETVEEFEIPPAPFRNLLTAFRQDQRKKRYETFNELLEYCRNSANPVGHIVLYLGRFHSEETAALSDSICTGLQLVNFWQDVARDYQKGRIYLPRESWRRAGYTEAMFEDGQFNDAFRQMLKAEVDRAEEYLHAGEPLVQRAPKSLQADVQLFIDGGLATAAAIRRCGYNVWKRRPRVSKLQRLRMLLGAWWNRPKDGV